MDSFPILLPIKDSDFRPYLDVLNDLNKWATSLSSSALSINVIFLSLSGIKYLTASAKD